MSQEDGVQHAQTVWLYYCVLLTSPWELQYHWNLK